MYEDDAYKLALWHVQWAYALELMRMCNEDPDQLIDGRPIQDITCEEIARVQEEPLDVFANRIGL